jgi:predicted GTPase
MAVIYKVFFLFFIGFGVSCAQVAPAFARSAGDALQVAVRAVSFLTPSVGKTVNAAIIYEAGDTASEEEARAIERSLAASNNSGSVHFRSRRVSTASLDQLSGIKVAFVTKGTNYRQVAAATSAQSIMTISFDPACTRAGHCVLSVSSRPKIQIVVSKSATTAARLRFNSSFLMLIKEI